MGKGNLPLNKGITLQLAEEGDEERDTEVDQDAMEDGHEHEVVAGIARDDGKRGVHCSGSSRADGSQSSEVTDKQGSAQEGEHLAEDIGHEGDRPQLGGQLYAQRRFLQLADKDGRKRIVGESTAYGQALREAPSFDYETDKGGEEQCSRNGRQGHEQKSWTYAPEDLPQFRVAPDTNPDLKHQGVKYVRGQIALHDPCREDFQPTQERTQ